MPDETSPASAYRDVMAIPKRGIFRYRNEAGRMVSLKDDAADLAFRKHLQATNGQGFDRAMVNEWNQAKTERREMPRPGEANDREAGKRALRRKKVREQRLQQGMARRKQAQAPDPRQAAAQEQRAKMETGPIQKTGPIQDTGAQTAAQSQMRAGATREQAQRQMPGQDAQAGAQGMGMMQQGMDVGAQMGSQVPRGQMPGMAQGQPMARQNSANDMKNAQIMGSRGTGGKGALGAGRIPQIQQGAPSPTQHGPIQIPDANSSSVDANSSSVSVPLSPQQISEQFQLQPQQAQQLRDQLADEMTSDEVLQRTYGLSAEEIGRLRGGLG